MPPGGDSGVTNSGALNEVPPDGYLLAEEPGGAPPEGTNLERLANKDQVNTMHLPDVSLHEQISASCTDVSIIKKALIL